MNNLSWTTWFLTLAAMFPAAFAHAAALDDAKAQLAQKNYEAVDKILSQDLAVRTPSAEALRVSLAAAIEAGKPVTAESRLVVLLKQQQDPHLLLTGAKIAEILSDEPLALTRYLAYARAETQKQEALESALAYVLKRDGYLEEFRKYVETFGATDRAWGLAEMQWRHFAGHRDGEQLLALADYLMQKWPDPARVEIVHQWLYSACDDYIFGREPRDRYWRAALVAAKHLPANGQNLMNLINQGQAGLTDQQRVQFAIDMAKTWGVPPQGSVSSISNWCLLNWFGLVRNVKDEETRLRLGREFLALETIYQRSANPEDYHQFLGLIWQLPDVFNVKGKALVTREALEQKFDAVHARLPAQMAQFAAENAAMQQGWPQDPAGRTAFLQRHFAMLDGQAVIELLQLTKNADFDRVVAEHLKGKSLRYTWNFRANILGLYAALHKKAELLAATQDYLAANPYTFSWQYLASNSLGSPDLSLAEKMDLLRKCFSKTGPSAPMTELLKQMANDKVLAAKAEFQAIQQEYRLAAAPSDPAMRAYAGLAAAGAPGLANPGMAAYAVAEKFLQEYKGAVPADADAARDRAEVQAAEICLLHRQLAWNTDATRLAWAELWAPRVGPGPLWTDPQQGILPALAGVEKGRADLYRILPFYFALLGANAKLDPVALSWISLVEYPNDGKPIALAGYFPQMGEAAAKFLARQLSNPKYNGPAVIPELDKLVNTPGFEFKDRAWWTGFIDTLTGWANSAHKVPLSLSRALLKFEEDEAARSGQADVARELEAISLQFRCGQASDGSALLSEYLAMVKQQRPAGLLGTCAVLFDWINLPEEPGATLTPGMRYYTLLKVVKPFYEQVPPEQWATVPLHGGLANLLSVGGGKFFGKPEYADFIALQHLLAKMTVAGATTDWGNEWLLSAYEGAMEEQIEKENWHQLMRWMPAYAGVLRASYPRIGVDQWQQVLAQRLKPLVTKLEAKKAYELAFAVVTAAEHNGDVPEESRRQLAILKATAALQIPGLIPVPATHPAYDLYAAAHALMLGNEAQAWELTRAKLNLLAGEWTSLDPAYVTWTLEQMRKQKQLRGALDLAMTILLREKDLPADVAARVSLTKGDIYVDMENYQAARLEFDSLRNNPLYNKTEAGALAVNHLINLMILTKDYSAAEGLLARLVDSDQVQVQADGYYFYAKMAYLQGDYKEAAANLHKVRDRVADHVEAALLQGEVNLHLPGGLQYTEVEIGNPRLTTIVIPGQVLTLTLNDANLSVARGKAWIPVILKTSKGGDEECVRLLPSSANKNLFVATIPTMLGRARKNNTMLELRGDDEISYEIEQSFQKANGLNYPPKTMEVRYDARLMASSGQILTETEEEKVELERRLQEADQGRQGSPDDHLRRYERDRNAFTVRPGGNIFVQVIDPAANTGDLPGTVKVALKTSSGDVLEGFELRETAAHSGIFRGAVPTGIPRPKATASDTEEGRGVNGVINSASPAPWVSLADGKQPKWLEVDTMGSHLVSSYRAEIPNAASLREATLEWQLAGDYEELAHYPPRTQATKGGVQLQVLEESRGETLEQWRGLVKAIGKGPTTLDTAAFDRQKDAPRKENTDAWFTARMTGVFYLPHSRALTLKFLQPPAGQWASAYLFVDRQQVLGGPLNEQTLRNTSRIELAKGIHQLEVLARDYVRQSKFVVGYETDEGTFEPLPRGWFSTKERPEIAAFLKPKATLKIDHDALVATLLDQPQRLRKMRLVFNDFVGTGVTVKSVTLKDEQGNVIVPVAEDFSSGKKSQALQIAPGDRIRVSYEDRRAIGGSKSLASDLDAAFYNGSIMLAYEEILDRPGNGRYILYHPARRCRVGDQLMVIVDDHDADISDDRDTVDVSVATSSGEKLTLKALETAINGDSSLDNHAGVFLATLKIGDRTRQDQIKVLPGDQITVSYLDKENTDPGVPIERTCSVMEAGGGAAKCLIYRTSVKQIEDTSNQAIARKSRIKARLGWAPPILADQVVARHPQYQPPGAVAAAAAAKSEETVVVALGAPLLFEVTCPKNALNSASVMYVTAVAESEMKAAAREGKKPTSLQVPLEIVPIDALAAAKGFPIQLQSTVRRDAKEMLQEGTFSGIVRFQLAKRGDPISDQVSYGDEGLGIAPPPTTDAAGHANRVPTLRVAGGDVVHLKYEDPQTKQTTDWKVRLLSDGRLELLDPSFTAQSDTIHLGGKFCLRVVDPDQDRSDARDTVEVRAAAASGDKLTLTLTETLPHSGVFETSFQPEFIGQRRPDGKLPPLPANKGDKLYVTFGDDVTFTYDDPECVSPPGTMTVTQVGHVAKGSDASLAVFSKQFKDPEMAVKTQFLTAEALFEMAKEHRKLQQKKKADEEIARGKAILEEAIRDYPQTSLAAQGDYLLANLAQELGDLGEAVSRYARVISSYPDSEYAAASQFKKAICYEKMENFDAACEEYVKLTYVYPESGFVADATLRLGNYYYKKEKYQVAAKIFFNFKQKNPTHKMAPQALFLAAQCALKQKTYAQAAKLFGSLVEEYQDEKALRAEAMYWMGDCYFKAGDGKNAYRGFKRLTWDYPDSDWAKYARGRLTDEAFTRMEEQPTP